MVPRLSPRGTQTEPTWYPDWAHMVPRLSPHGTQTEPTWYPYWAHMVARLSPSSIQLIQSTCCLVSICTVSHAWLCCVTHTYSLIPLSVTNTAVLFQSTRGALVFWSSKMCCQNICRVNHQTLQIFPGCLILAPQAKFKSQHEPEEALLSWLSRRYYNTVLH